jgi:hypothetical protein
MYFFLCDFISMLLIFSFLILRSLSYLKLALQDKLLKAKMMQLEEAPGVLDAPEHLRTLARSDNGVKKQWSRAEEAVKKVKLVSPVRFSTILA